MTAKKKTETPEQRHDRLAKKAKAEQEARDERRREASEALEQSVTQREWLLICKRLEVTRQQIDNDYGLRVLALSWVNQKRSHGGAEWDRLLDLTDEELLDLLPGGDDQESQDPAETA